jgi:hypothetical protein
MSRKEAAKARPKKGAGRAKARKAASDAAFSAGRVAA